jgi:hypothetical protein
VPSINIIASIHEKFFKSFLFFLHVGSSLENSQQVLAREGKIEFFPATVIFDEEKDEVNPKFPVKFDTGGFGVTVLDVSRIISGGNGEKKTRKIYYKPIWCKSNKHKRWEE